MRLPAPFSWSREDARSGKFDGKFIIGVRTTGIYCLPSCPTHPPKPENVTLVRTEAEAQALGLRACKRCRPDLYYRGVDEGTELFEGLAARVAADSAAFTDASALATFRFSQGPKAGDLVLLPDIISKEPLGVMVRKGDDKWFDLVRWSFVAALTAEENDVNSKNIDTFADTKVPDIRRLLGLEGELGKALGVDQKWAYNIVKQVGNFGEIWDRNITPMGVPRGINNLWNKGGMQYSPPMR